MPYAVGIDSGTQGTRALVVDFSGRVLGRGHAGHRMVAGLGPGASEQDPRTWTAALEKALAAALRRSRIDPARILCLGVSAQQHGFVPLDGEGRPLRPAKLWNDTSTLAETEEIVATLGGRSAFSEKLGIHLAVGFTASKILWLKKNEPQHWRLLATVLLPHNYLNFHLAGVRHMEYGDASGTGLLDIRSRRWNEAALAAVDPGLAAKLPPPSHPAEPAGWIRREVAERFGMKKVLLAAGGGDNMMAAIGSGNVREGIVTLSLGTSGTVYAFRAGPLCDPRGEIAAFCDSTGGWLPLLCTMNVTNASELLKGLLGVSNAGLNRAAASCPAGASGLLFLPFVDGERVPALPEASAVLFGMTRRTFSAPHLARAVLEGAIFNIGYGLDRMRELGLECSEIRATGGGARNRIWLQIAADVFAARVVQLQEAEAGAFGAALQAIWTYRNQKGERLGIADITDRCVRLGAQAALPDPDRSRMYRELQESFNRLWRTLAAEFPAHRRLQGKLA